MNVDFFNGFTYNWAQSGIADVLDDAQYKLGWAFIGASPPTVEQFNAVQQLTDQKLAWLYGQIKTAADAKDITLAGDDLGSLLDLLNSATPGQASTTVAGILKLATTALAQGLTDDGTALTPKKLADALGIRVGHTFAVNDWAKRSDGLIEQWGSVSCTATADNSQGTGTVVTLPVAVSQVLNIQATPTFSYEELGALSAYGSTVSGTQIRIVLDWSQGTGGGTLTQAVYWRALCRPA